MNTRFTLNKIALATLVASVTTLTACSNDNTNQADTTKAHASAEQIWPKLNIAVIKDAEIGFWFLLKRGWGVS